MKRLRMELRSTKANGKNVSAVYTLQTYQINFEEICGIGLVNQRINSVTKDAQMVLLRVEWAMAIWKWTIGS